jgi:hypothetical protein
MGMGSHRVCEARARPMWVVVEGGCRTRARGRESTRRRTEAAAEEPLPDPEAMASWPPRSRRGPAAEDTSPHAGPSRKWT